MYVVDSNIRLINSFDVLLSHLLSYPHPISLNIGVGFSFCCLFGKTVVRRVLCVVQEFAKEEETLRAAYQSVHGIYELLSSDGADDKNVPPLEEVNLDAAPYPLSQQFGLRAPFILGKVQLGMSERQPACRD